MGDQFGRRAFLGRSAALASVLGGVEALHAARERGDHAANIIWMVADGMSPGVLTLAEQFSARARAKGTVWHALLGRPDASHAFMDTASLDSLVTDSSSSSSAWGSGSRILNAWINMLPDGTRLVPIATLARDKGKRVGLVTTTTVTHATPAGFAAVSRRRDDEELIAEQYLNVCDVLLGGGRKIFSARRDKRDLLADYRKAGFTTVGTRPQLLQASGARLLGLFTDSHFPFTLDQLQEKDAGARLPTLAEMAETALTALENSPKGFLLQVEGGRVDHAAHNNDAASMMWEQLAFDDAVAVVLRFAQRHPNTLVVITSDHGNSNPGLNGMGREYGQSDTCFDRLLAARSSFTTLTPRLGVSTEYTMKSDAATAQGARPAAANVRDLLHESLGLDLSDAETEWLRSAVAGTKGLAISKQYDKVAGVLGQVVGNHTGIGWTGTSHTADHTILTALGPGSQRFRGFIRNTDVFPILCELMDVKHRNPKMPPERARQFRTAADARRERPHWV